MLDCPVEGGLLEQLLDWFNWAILSQTIVCFIGLIGFNGVMADGGLSLYVFFN